MAKGKTKKRTSGGKKSAPTGNVGLEAIAKLIAPEMSKTGQLETYKKSLYVFACISKIAEKVASVKLEMFKVTNSKGDMQEVKNHPALDLLAKYNPFQTKSEFLKTTIINKKLSGDAFWFKVRNKGGKVVELWNLRPDWMTIIADPTNFIKGYEFRVSDGSVRAFLPEDIVHFKDSPDPTNVYYGMSALKPAQMRIQTEDFATQYQRDFFLNSARPDAVLKNPAFTLTPEQKEEIKDSWGKRHQGVGKTHKIAILEGGMEYQLISLTQKEMDFIESMRFTRDDILVAFKVPKPIVAITDDVNRANAETAMFIFLSETIKPELVEIIEKINEELITPDFGEELLIDFVDPTPDNRDLELKEYDNGLKDNYLLINEVREMEGLPPIKGGWSFYRPLMDVPMGGLPQSDLQKSLQKAISSKDVYLKSEPKEEDKMVFDFAGKYWLKRKFEIAEAVVEEMIEGIKIAKNKGKKKKNKKSISLIKDEQLRRDYAAMVNKKTDLRAGKLKEGTTAFAMGQRDRVQKNLADAIGVQKKGRKKITVTMERIFDKESENGLAIEFITPYLAQFIKDSGIDAISMVAPQETFELTKRIQNLIKKRAKEFAESVNNTTLEGLDQTLSEGIVAGEGIRDLANRVEKVYGEFPTYRSELVARTEATAANNEGFLEGYEQSGVATGKEWINAGDERVRIEHQDVPIGVGTEIVGLREAFSNGLQFPQEYNCRCVLGPAFLE